MSSAAIRPPTASTETTTEPMITGVFRPPRPALPVPDPWGDIVYGGGVDAPCCAYGVGAGVG